MKQVALSLTDLVSSASNAMMLASDADDEREMWFYRGQAAILWELALWIVSQPDYATSPEKM